MLSHLTLDKEWKHSTYIKACLENAYQELTGGISYPIVGRQKPITVPLGTNKKGEHQLLQSTLDGSGWVLLTHRGTTHMGWWREEVKLSLSRSNWNRDKTLYLFMDDIRFADLYETDNEACPMELSCVERTIPEESLKLLLDIVFETIEEMSPYNAIAKAFTLEGTLSLNSQVYPFLYGQYVVLLKLSTVVREDDRLGIGCELSLADWDDEEETSVRRVQCMITLEDISLYGLMEPVIREELIETYEVEQEELDKLLSILNTLYQVVKIEPVLEKHLRDVAYMQGSKY